MEETEIKIQVKNTVLKVLPFWLIFLILVTAVQIGAFQLIKAPVSSKVTNQTPVPQVLGASISLRGEAPSTVSEIPKLKEPDLSNISAKSFLAFDLDSGREYIKENENGKLSIASLTKLLTALVAYKTADLNANFTISAKSNIDTKPVLGLVAGDSVKAVDVLNSMIVGSCNDAALALAQYVSDSENKSFITLMNDTAKEIGMNNSNFSNPMGFDSRNNYSTAEDLKILITETEKLAIFNNLGRRTSYSFSGSNQKTYTAYATNKLIKNHPDIQAIKTGFTESAGGAMATKITLGSRDIAILVLNSQNREGDTLKIKQQLENSFNWQP